MTSFIKSWKEMGVRKEPWEVCELKNTFFTLEHKLGKKKHQKVREKGRQVWCACCSILERIWEEKKKKTTHVKGDFA